ncbi:TonB-dependent receptor [Sphingomonas psychrotolerans]|uniref:TonB-dependent receptor n=1 Tax=Sphingomonas psychrotolerans TaxID=1327635 RepID=A0A2K8MDZ8_9SPHN|nr:TonB-dependent receptor [Sphingomonas psychrotolerans]ATY32115.1 TonB-dependent receptor [Sphingomonas psychrotolerans]
MHKHAIHASENPAKLKSGLLRAGVSAAALCLFGAGSAWAQTEASPTPPPAQDASDAAAQDAPAEDEIVVQGYREALRSAQQIKRTSDSVVDSVTAEDIGALPDRSVVETLQRIPGVSISRFAAGNDPDHFAVEGSQATVRGLTYVRSEFNGREAFSALNGRSLGFQDVASELLGGVDVFKTPTADRIEGGISGIVNLRTRLPFDSKGTYVAGALELNYGDFVDKSAPTLSVLASTRWDTGIGEIGILGSVVYSQLYTRNDRLQVSSFRVRPIYSDGTRTDVVPFTGATQQGSGIFPRGAVMGTQEFERERYGYSAALQWRSNDGSMEAAFQFLRSDARQDWTENTIEIATDNVTSNGDSRARAGTSVSFDDDMLFDKGLITGPTGWRSDQQVAPGTGAALAGRRTPAFGLQSNNQYRQHVDRSVTDDYGFNFKWDVSERFGLSVDYDHVESSGEVLDNGIWSSTFQDVYIDLNGLNVPTVNFVAPQNCVAPNAQGVCTAAPGSTGNDPTYYTGTHQSFLDPYNSFWRSAMDHAEESSGNSDAFRIDAELSFPDTSFLKSVKAGYRYADRDQIARNSTYNWGGLSEIWGNGGPVWLDENIGGVGGDQLGTTSQAANYQPAFFNNFFRGQTSNPSGAGGEGRLYYSGRPASDYASYIAFANAVRNEWLPAGTAPTGGAGGWLSLADRPGTVNGSYYLPGEINPIEEINHAAYVMAKIQQDFSNGWNLNGNLGVRYSTTRRTSSGFVQYATTDPLTSDANCRATIQTIVNPAAGQTPPNPPTVPAGCAFLYTNPAARAAARSFQNGAVVPNDYELTYDYWLPSVNLKLEVGGGLQFRAAFFKGISPPNTTQIRNYFPIALGAQTPIGATLTVVPNTATADPNDGIIQGENVVRIEGAGIRVGSPDLKPVTANNFDLTAEWYFNQVGSLTLSAFYKEVKGVVVFNTERQSFTNNGQTYEAVVSREFNSPETGKVKGIEIAYQQTYDFLPGFLSGLGLQANYTYVDSSGVPQPTLPPGDPSVAGGLVSNIDVGGFGLQGLSKHNFNITPFYDYKGLSLRASYSWRSRYMLTTRDVITPFDPVFQEDYGQLDASLFYQVSKNLRLGVQGVNLTNAITKTSVAIQGPDGVDDIRVIPRGWFMNDRRISMSARFNF